MPNAGGKATAIILRKQALDRYYANPSICKYCKKIIEVKEGHSVRDSRRKSFCDQTCNGNFHANDVRISQTGRISSKETCDKISKALKGKHHEITNSTRLKLSQALKGRNGKPLSADHKRKFCQGRKASDETRSKLSLKACSNKHKFNNFKHVPYITYTKLDGTEIIMRGSYEVRFAKYLDSKNLNWKYGYKNKISYISSEGVKKYMIPDFFILDFQRYFDTKGYLSKESIEKMKLVKEQKGICIQLIYLKDIEDLENNLKTLKDYIAE